MYTLIGMGGSGKVYDIGNGEAEKKIHISRKGRLQRFYGHHQRNAGEDGLNVDIQRYTGDSLHVGTGNEIVSIALSEQDHQNLYRYAKEVTIGSFFTQAQQDKTPFHTIHAPKCTELLGYTLRLDEHGFLYGVLRQPLVQGNLLEQYNEFRRLQETNRQKAIDVLSTLEQHITRRHALHIVNELAETMLYLHRNGIMYLDAKPANTFVDTGIVDGRITPIIRFLDFGSSHINGGFRNLGKGKHPLTDFAIDATLLRIIEEQEQRDPFLDATPAYAPPSYFLGDKSVDVDNWSFAVMATEFLSGMHLIHELRDYPAHDTASRDVIMKRFVRSTRNGWMHARQQEYFKDIYAKIGSWFPEDGTRDIVETLLGFGKNEKTDHRLADLQKRFVYLINDETRTELDEPFFALGKGDASATLHDGEMPLYTE